MRRRLLPMVVSDSIVEWHGKTQRPARKEELMAGNPHEGTSSPRTVLEHILWGEDYSYEEIAARFDLVASELGERASITGRHLRRLASGERTGANPVTRRVLQAMF